MTTARDLLEIDPKLIFDMAARIKPPHILAAEYGLDQKHLEHLMALPYVQKLVKEKAEELEKSGFVLQTKAKWMLDEMMAQGYKRGMSANATLSSLVEFMKFLRDLGGLAKQEPQTQERFAINVIFNGMAPDRSRPNSVVIDVEGVKPAGGPTNGTSANAAHAAIENEAGSVTIDLSELPPAPAWLSMGATASA